MDTGRFTLPNGVTLSWHKNVAGGRSYTSDEMGVELVIWDTAMTSTATLFAALIRENELACLEQLNKPRSV